MLDILELAREKGLEEGKAIGLHTLQDMVVDAVLERFDVVTVRISEGIRRIRNSDTLRGMHRQAIKCKDLGEFEAVLRQMTS